MVPLPRWSSEPWRPRHAARRTSCNASRRPCSWTPVQQPRPQCEREAVLHHCHHLGAPRKYATHTRHKKRYSAPVDNHPLHAVVMLPAKYSFQRQADICGTLLVDQGVPNKKPCALRTVKTTSALERPLTPMQIFMVPSHVRTKCSFRCTAFSYSARLHAVTLSDLTISSKTAHLR